jgi:RNA polymerase sigma-70 factor (ECF subfamily)
MKILRCKADAEDIVQDTFLKWLSAEKTHIENTKAYLITSVKNNALNHLASLKRKKEECLDSFHLPELFLKFKESDFAHLDLEIELSKALSIIHHKLEPLEKAVYLLKEALGFEYDELQKVLDKKQEHCRQLFSRAKKKIEDSKLSIELSKTPHMLESFKKACTFGNASDLINELKTDIAASIRKKF